MGYSENKILQKLCHNFSDYEDSISWGLGDGTINLVYGDCYKWDEDLRKNNFKKYKKVNNKFTEIGMNELSIPCRIKKSFEDNVEGQKVMTEDKYVGLFVYIAYAPGEYDIHKGNLDLYKRSTTPRNFKFLLDIAIRKYINQENGVGGKILKLAYKHRNKPSAFIEELFRTTIDV
jgi:hypothetical protein